MISRLGVLGAAALCGLFGFTSVFAQSMLADNGPPGAIPVYPPANPQSATEVRSNAPMADTRPELIHYRFDGTGLSVPNLASAPPTGAETATILGGISQTGTDLNSSGNGFSLLGNGAASSTDYLNTGWATNLVGSSWTISFVSSNFESSSTLFYVFGDVNAGSFRCFTNGIAGANNWILRGPFTDVLVPGGATLDTHRTTFVYDRVAGEIRAYLDGVLVNTVAQAAIDISGTGPFKVMGYSANVGAPSGGLLDDFRVYNRALTAQEVIDLDTAPGELTISPGSVPFGDVMVDATSDVVTVTLANISVTPVNVTALTTPDPPFARSGGTCGSLPIYLPAGADCTLDYTFAPTAAGPFDQSLTVTSDGLGSGSIDLSGTGLQGNLIIDPAGIDFGSVLVGSASGESAVTLSNNGTASLDVISLTAATGDFARTGGTCAEVLPITIAAGDNCTLGYTFSPEVTGLAEQALTVTADAPGGGSIDLSGTGVQGNLVIDPASIDFGTLTVGDVSALGTITLSNDGDGELSVTSLSLATDPFTRTTDGSCGNLLPIAIAIGQSCTLTYVFAPTLAGSAQQSFVLAGNGSGDTGFELSGESLPAENEIFLDGFEPFN